MNSVTRHEADARRLASPSVLRLALVGVLWTAPVPAQGTVIFPVFDPGNSRANIQAALDTASVDHLEVVLAPQASPWIIDDGLHFRPAGNTTLTLQPGAILQTTSVTASCTPPPPTWPGGPMIEVINRTGVTIVGYDAELRMNNPDCRTANNNAVLVRNATNFALHGLTIRNAGNDGIYVAGNSSRRYSENVALVNVRVIGATRSAFTVISGKNVTIENCSGTLTGGLPTGVAGPECGLDIEPNSSDEILSGIYVRRCYFGDNEGHGITIPLNHLGADVAERVDIRVENCWINNCGANGLKNSWQFQGAEATQVVGTVAFSNVLIENSGEHAIFVRKRDQPDSVLTFTNCIVRRMTTTSTQNACYFDAHPTMTTASFGGALFSGCMVYDTVNRPFLVCKTYNYTSGRPLYSGIDGTITVANPFGAHASYGPNEFSNDLAVTPLVSVPPVTASVSLPDASGGEVGPDTLTLRFNRSSANVGYPLAVLYAMTGTATNGADYDFLHGLAIIPPGATGRAFTITPRADGRVEGAETLISTLMPTTYYVTGFASTATGTIVGSL